jgi:hypothetical protein
LLREPDEVERCKKLLDAAEAVYIGFGFSLSELHASKGYKMLADDYDRAVLRSQHIAPLTPKPDVDREALKISMDSLPSDLEIIRAALRRRFPEQSRRQRQG